ncbi:hypothetical protein J7F03_28775 [Streptomyces sp. ISL-43]|uniref:hypothetical protein n=1 Tax=Streptomyces sp. ISL-43 TaxID=2819183 RepID=UPI001BE6DFCF|nr:hypothetical protein [Streptomyces sp. ISL-43]MBT2451000.1 hypothetical protein [Streptomyces sp. ISL-43]
MEASAQRPANESVEDVEMQHQQDGGAVRAEVESDGLVFKRELLNEFLANRVRS